MTLFNPSASYPRTVAFAWLLGKDADDAYTARGGGVGNASETLDDMLARASRVHKSLDELSALQQFVDVRFARALHAAGLTGGRVQWWTLAESLVVVLVAAAQAYLITSFELRGPLGVFLGKRSGGGGGGGAFASGAAAAKMRGGAGAGGHGHAASAGAFHAV